MLTLLMMTTAASAGDWHQLRAPEARASSFLKSNWNQFNENYHPSYLLDGDPKTAWVEGVKGTGAGEWVEWPVSAVREVHRVKLRLRNGYQKSPGLHAANAALTEVRVQLRNGPDVVVDETWTVPDTSGWVEHVLDPPDDFDFDTVRLTVVGVREGTKYADLCVSDAEVWVDTETPYQSAVENGKHLVLTNWAEQRREAAEWFAAKPRTYPFVSTHFESVYSKGTPDSLAAAESTAAALQAHAANGSPERLSQIAVKERIPMPDGLHVPLALSEFFTPGLTFFESAPDATRTVAYRPPGEWADTIVMSAIRESSDGDDRWLAFQQTTTSTERGSMTYTSDWVVHLREGRPVAALQSKHSAGTQIDHTCGELVDRYVYRFEWDGDVVERMHTGWGSRCTERPGADELTTLVTFTAG